MGLRGDHGALTEDVSALLTTGHAFLHSCALHSNLTAISLKKQTEILHMPYAIRAPVLTIQPFTQL